ncbi:TPA: hypothetical protein DIV55_04715 [Patescibacteria group bacterium]|uniref:Isoprenylcysteine carboxyl methyltransferase n=1 Tax=Candidatus Gottesmanbacteria bacterium GW2011_GWA1_43_11 TaxID=1618436 RepID=A0A0G1CK38_9BACT|nr:MAG: hypothetical protein UV59_C0004G0012 [Candidatus Gottesmanbacteria bacterium GW2011_GWA1_43_11]HCS79015.1 hypothetical protein [Patescibacteria group bacterium]
MTKLQSDSILVVLLQISTIGFIIISGPGLPVNPVFYVPLLAAIGLIAWAVWELYQNSLFSLKAKVRKGARLVTTGPYQYIRNPMYTGYLLFALSLVLDYFSWFRLMLWLILASTIFLQVSVEEQSLHEHFPDYAKYKRKTKSLFPFLY